MVMEVIYRILGAIIVIGALAAMAPSLISMSVSPICNIGNFSTSVNMCVYDVPVNGTCYGGWAQVGELCEQKAKYNDATSQLIILIAIVIAFIGGIVYIFRERQYS